MKPELERLHEPRFRQDLVHCIKQFYSYTPASSLARNNFIVSVLEDLLHQSKKAQLEEIEWLANEL